MDGARCSGCRGAATGASTTSSIWLRSPRSVIATVLGRAYYERKIAEGKSGKEATRALKRRISDAIYIRLRDDAARAARVTSTGPGGQPGNDTETCVAGSHPEHRLFGEATPEPATTLRPTGTRIRQPRPNVSIPAIRKTA